MRLSTALTWMKQLVNNFSITTDNFQWNFLNFRIKKLKSKSLNLQFVKEN